MQLPKTYEPAKYEDGIYKLWEKSGAFKPTGKGEPFCIIMPPPNANGALHWGHAIGYTLTDVIIRYQRMRGRKTLWLPGTDHAGIETQFVYERDVLAPLGKSHLDFTPEQFYKDVLDFTLKQQDKILSQFRAMGFSADWSKLKFTLDPDIIKIVYDTFRQMYKDGHVYRGPRIVNWCPHCQAAFADIEIERREQEDPFYTLQYGPFQIGTARPETKFGDKYVVMHPDDERYAKYKTGDTFTAEWINGKVKAMIVKDAAIDPKFGTGVMTITPWHDPIDFEIAERHGLDKERIIDFKGKLLPIAQEFAGLPIEKARPKIVAKLKSKELLVKIERHTHAIGIHDRCGTVIEPQISTQWFLRIKALNKPVIKALEKDEINFFPKRFKKVALNWLKLEHDWCISRDSCWWGIRMPIYYPKSKSTNKKPYIIADNEQPAVDYYGKGKYRAETATFDTWFSSGQWPFATLMGTGDFKDYYPTDLMGTAREILHKWVTRMVMFGLYRTNEVPFKNVYLWGLVTDARGKKMSKSKGNVVNPLAMTAKYGTDALRLAGAISNTPGTDSPMDENQVMGMRNFNNKLWNVTRFVLSQFEDADYKPGNQPKPKSIADEWLLSCLNQAIGEISIKFEDYRLNEAAYAVYHLLWNDFADWYLEASKVEVNVEMMLYGLETILKLAHPFMPFITETIWSLHFSRDKQTLLITAPWPKVPRFDSKKSAEFTELQKIISEIRAIKTELELADVSLYYRDGELLDQGKPLVTKLARISSVEQVARGEGLTLTNTSINCWLGVDHTTIKRYHGILENKKVATERYLAGLKAKLDNPAFKKSAPKEVVELAATQYNGAQQKLATLIRQIKRTGG